MRRCSRDTQFPGNLFQDNKPQINKKRNWGRFDKTVGPILKVMKIKVNVRYNLLTLKYTFGFF